MPHINKILILFRIHIIWPLLPKYCLKYKRLTTMKKILFILIFITIQFSVFGQIALDIEGSSDEKHNGRIVLLLFKDIDNEGIVKIETTIIENGKFQFNKEIHNQDIFKVKSISDLFIIALDSYSNTEGSEVHTEAFLEEGKITVTLDSAFHISGTTNNDLLQSYHNLKRKPFSATHVDFIKENINNYMGIKAFTDYYQPISDEDVSNILAIASETFKNDKNVELCFKSREIIKSLNKEERERQRIKGTKVKDFDLITVNDEKKKLYDYIGKSKYLIIDFWASWCKPCIASMPHMIELWEKYKAKDIEFIGISLDTEDNKNAWLNAAKRINVPWELLSDLKGTDSVLTKSFAVSDIPYTVIVNEEGIILDCIRFPVKYLEPFLENLP